jgi:NAD(P)H-hydrate epimerase
MERFLSIKETQALDRIAIEECGVPSLALMENAGRSVARAAIALIPEGRTPRITVVCGTGNNAGDGFVAARHIHNAGYAVTVVMIGSADRLKKDPMTYYRVLEKCQFPIMEAPTLDSTIQTLFTGSDVIVDAIFGVGLNRPIESPHKEFIEWINASPARVISVDIPSGLNGDTGEIYGVSVRADLTVTFMSPKKGFGTHKGKTCTGEVRVADIGIPRCLMEKINGRF